MKKYLFLASVFAFMSCSSSDDKVVEQKVSESDKIIFTAYDYKKEEMLLYIYNLGKEELSLVNAFPDANFSFMEGFAYDHVSKSMYAVTRDNSKLVGFDYNKKQEIFKKEIKPAGFGEFNCSVLSNSGKLVGFNFDKNKGDNGFRSIDIKSGVMKLETESVELTKLIEEANSIYHIYDPGKNEMSALIEKFDFLDMGKTVLNTVLVKINVDNFKDFDNSTKNKIIKIDTESLGTGYETAGLIQDKNGVYYLGYVHNSDYSKVTIASINSQNGSLTKLFDTAGLYGISEMTYDKKSHTIIALGNRKTDGKVVCMQYNLATNSKKELVLEIDLETRSLSLIQ